MFGVHLYAIVYIYIYIYMYVCVCVCVCVCVSLLYLWIKSVQILLTVFGDYQFITYISGTEVLNEMVFHFLKNVHIYESFDHNNC